MFQDIESVQSWLDCQNHCMFYYTYEVPQLYIHLNVAPIEDALAW